MPVWLGISFEVQIVLFWRGSWELLEGGWVWGCRWTSMRWVPGSWCRLDFIVRWCTRWLFATSRPSSSVFLGSQNSRSSWSGYFCYWTLGRPSWVFLEPMLLSAFESIKYQFISIHVKERTNHFRTIRTESTQNLSWPHRKSRIHRKISVSLDFCHRTHMVFHWNHTHEHGILISQSVIRLPKRWTPNSRLLSIRLLFATVTMEFLCFWKF